VHGFVSPQSWLAAMTTLDAARLLIAVAGCSFVKDPIETLEGLEG
jgi:hypothetical protein